MERYEYKEPGAGCVCAATTNAGSPCRAWKMVNSDYCASHDPHVRDLRKNRRFHVAAKDNLVDVLEGFEAIGVGWGEMDAGDLAAAERDAIMDVARLLFRLAAELGPRSFVAQRFTRCAERLVAEGR